MPNRALIVVDMQNDFMPDGALPVQGGDEVVEVINALMERFDLVVASQDWHPPDHGSFASNHDQKEPGETVELAGLEQFLWPDHCVQHTEGAEFVDGLHTERFDHVVRKGTDPKYDSYSAFWDNGHKKATNLGSYLREMGVDTVYIAGVATDYCVNFTVRDACREEFDTHVILDACRGVVNQPGDIEQAVVEMVDAGATVVGAQSFNRKL
jgi:nicotinamidase/pyrazinamidase